MKCIFPNEIAVQKRGTWRRLSENSTGHAASWIHLPWISTSRRYAKVSFSPSYKKETLAAPHRGSTWILQLARHPQHFQAYRCSITHGDKDWVAASACWAPYLSIAFIIWAYSLKDSSMRRLRVTDIDVVGRCKKPVRDGCLCLWTIVCRINALGGQLSQMDHQEGLHRPWMIYRTLNGTTHLQFAVLLARASPFAKAQPW